MRSPAELQRIAATLEELDERKTYGGGIRLFKPYPKQELFFELGAGTRERLLIAGNQVGKTMAGAFETACHLTGQYPEWWKGRRFGRPIRAWICGESSVAVRDIQQTKLCGAPGVESAFGSGMLPRSSLVDKSLGRGPTDYYDTVQVRHVSGGVSTGSFKSYEQGRSKFQGESLDVIWFDEEPDEDIYAEGLTRTVATGGIAFMTFTPLRGRSSVVLRFFDEASMDRAHVLMTIDDAQHISAEQKERIINAYLPHEREARAHGIPILGSGRIFQSSEEAVREAAIDHIPAYWTKLWGIDFGIDHPFAAVLIIWDKENDVIHVAHAIRIRDGLPITHAAAMKRIAASVPVAWPHDGGVREKTTGEPLSAMYRKCGLRMLDQHAKFEDGSNSTEAGVYEMGDRMQTGRLRVASHLSDWFEEFRFYHRKDGQIVKIKDDLMSATRIGVMAKRFGKAVPLGGEYVETKGSYQCRNVDFDPFGLGAE